MEEIYLRRKPDENCLTLPLGHEIQCFTKGKEGIYNA